MGQGVPWHLLFAERLFLIDFAELHHIASDEMVLHVVEDTVCLVPGRISVEFDELFTFEDVIFVAVVTSEKTLDSTVVGLDQLVGGTENEAGRRLGSHVTIFGGVLVVPFGEDLAGTRYQLLRRVVVEERLGDVVICIVLLDGDDVVVAKAELTKGLTVVDILDLSSV